MLDKFKMSPSMQAIYNLLQDAESRFIYEKYVDKYWTESVNDTWLYELLHGSFVYAYNRAVSRGFYGICDDSVIAAVRDNKKKFDSLYLYPKGIHSLFVAKLLIAYGVEISGFIDRNPDLQGTYFFNRPVISLKQYKEVASGGRIGLMVGSYRFQGDIITNVLPKYDIKDYYRIGYIGEPEYFCDVWNPCQDEVYVDVGVWDGGTINGFAEWIKNAGFSYKKIYAVEASERLIPNIWYETKYLKNVEIVNAAAGSETGNFRYYEEATAGQISKQYDTAGDNATIPTKRIDDIVRNAPVTFIKMDIEGSEMSAIQGASETILRHKPKLAICIYHKMDDIIKIPQYIHELVPEYKFYIRQHALSLWETVLYAHM